MENENQEELKNVIELNPKPKRSRRSKQSKESEPVLPVTIDEPVVEEAIEEMETIVIEAEAPAPAAPTPPAPVAAPNPEPAVAIQPKKSEWKPLVRPRRQVPPPSGPGRHQKKAR